MKLVRYQVITIICFIGFILLTYTGLALASMGWCGHYGQTYNSGFFTPDYTDIEEFLDIHNNTISKLGMYDGDRVAITSFSRDRTNFELLIVNLDTKVIEIHLDQETLSELRPADANSERVRDGVQVISMTWISGGDSLLFQTADFFTDDPDHIPIADDLYRLDMEDGTIQTILPPGSGGEYRYMSSYIAVWTLNSFRIIETDGNYDRGDILADYRAGLEQSEVSVLEVNGNWRTDYADLYIYVQPGSVRSTGVTSQAPIDILYVNLDDNSPVKLTRQISDNILNIYPHSQTTIVNSSRDDVFAYTTYDGDVTTLHLMGWYPVDVEVEADGEFTWIDSNHPYSAIARYATENEVIYYEQCDS